MADPSDLVIGCALDGEVLQTGPCLSNDLHGAGARRTSVVDGNAIARRHHLTGTPSGVGQARTPERFLKPRETLVSTIEGVVDRCWVDVARIGQLGQTAP